MNLEHIAARLDATGAFRQRCIVSVQEKPGLQYVAETEIVLDRSAKRKIGGRSIEVPGTAISLRLVMAKVLDPVSGVELSRWYLLTNVPVDVSAETVALWDYWRWEIESFFKLMKSGGQQLEHWQQESGWAVLNG